MNITFGHNMQHNDIYKRGNCRKGKCQFGELTYRIAQNYSKYETVFMTL